MGDSRAGMCLEGIGSATAPTGAGGTREPKARRREPAGGLNVEGVEVFEDASADEEANRGVGATTPGGGGRMVDVRDARTLDPSGCGSIGVGLFEAEGEIVSTVADDMSTESKGCEPSEEIVFVIERPSA